MCPIHNRLTANTHKQTSIMTDKKPLYKRIQDGKIHLDPQQALDMPPEVYRAIQYLEYRKLRHKHPHV